MSLFLATLVVTLICGLLMGVGLLLAGKPLEGGCGKAPPGLPRCEGCPNRENHEPGECPNRGNR
jgi:hypothetical protein